MNKRKALIWGIAGQDGSYLAELLLDKNYDVYGIIRRHSIAENQDSRINHIVNLIHTEYGDLLDTSSISHSLSLIKPDYIFSLAAQSHVRVSFDMPLYTFQVNALGIFNLLEEYHKICPKARFLQASSSEMFGNIIDVDGFQRETTPMQPVNPYGIAKLAAFSAVNHYHRAYGLFTCNSICFNHTSPRRGTNFICAKIVKTAVEIKLGLASKLELGNIDTSRDFGHSKDYVIAMEKIINYTNPDNFVIASGETHSIRELCEYVFKKLDLNYENYIQYNPKYMRSEELQYLKGDASKAKTMLQWQPTYTFYSILDEMIEYWSNYYA